MQQFSLEIELCRTELKVHIQTIQDDLRTVKAVCIKSEKTLNIYPFKGKLRDWLMQDLLVCLWVL